jgi:putative PIN family toxin of toxin-antitoxin system
MPPPGSRPLRLVPDTNVVVAGLLWNGPPRRLLEAATEHADQKLFFTSPALLSELRHTLRYPKFVQRIERFSTSADALVAQYAALVSLVTPATVPRVVSRDADDDHVIAAAVAAHATLIVSGDRHLLSMGSYEGIEIVTAATTAERLDARS